jgi:hypothetical protein
MSAYICDRGTIAYLVEAGKSWDTAKTPMLWANRRRSFSASFGSQAAYGPITNQRAPAEVGQMLWDENIRSVQALFPDLNLRGLPGPCGETFKYSEHRVPPGSEVTIFQVISTCENFTYQSCEGEGMWKESEAYSYIEALQRLAIEKLRLLAKEDSPAWGAPSDWVEYCRLPDKGVKA